MALGKSGRAKLRELAGKAYQRELDHELRGLALTFDSWRNGKIDCFELSDRIHEFHDGVSRQLHVMYEQMKPEMAVGRAVARGLVSSNEIPPGVLPEIQKHIDFFRQDLENDKADR
jgi:hypothetical protein